MSDLTDKQAAFVEEYLIDFNATRAAERAGYRGSDSTLASVGSENLRKPKIREKIDARLRERAMSADEVLMRLADQARLDWSDFYDIGSEGIPFLNLKKAEEAGKLHLISRYWLTAQGYRRVEFHDPQRALEMIGRAHMLFKDGLEVTGRDGRDLIPSRLADALDQIYGSDPDDDEGDDE